MDCKLVLSFALAVFSSAATFLGPGEGSFEDPALGHDRQEGSLATLGDLHRNAEEFLDGLRKWLADVSPICQNAFY